MEHTREALLSEWLGTDQVQFMNKAGTLLAKMGGFPLPKLPEMVHESKYGVLLQSVEVQV
jgi:hypothetical protein